MIYKFKLVSDEVSNFSRDIDIDSNDTFLQLRNAILDSVDYSKEHEESFFLCDEDWDRHEEIALFDPGSESDEDVWIMEDTPLNEMIEEEGQKLCFTFDYENDRSFFMELKEAVPGKNLSSPICTMKKGKAPSQILASEEPEVKTETIIKTPEDLEIEEIYDEGQYDEEDISDGFDIENIGGEEIPD